MAANSRTRFTGRNIDPSVMRELSSCLNAYDAYKELAGYIMRRNSRKCRFTADDMRYGSQNYATD